MKKLVTVLHADDGAVDEFVPALWAHVEHTRTLRHVRRVINIVDLTPADCGWNDVTGYPAFHALDEIWFGSMGDLADFVAGYGLPEHTATAWHYGVDEVVRKDTRAERLPDLGARARAPGVKEVFLLTRPAGKTREQFAEHWRDVHGPLALRQHVGLWKYVQNIVTTWFTPEAPEFDGIAELHYPSLDDADTRRHASPEGHAEIAADRPKFVGDSIWLFAGEYGV